MLTGRNKDIDALRAGIREQERFSILREQSDENAARIQRRIFVPSNEVFMRPAVSVGVGDILVSTSNGYSFYEDSEVTYADSTAPGGTPIRGDVWLSYEFRDGGSGGHSLYSTEYCLIRNDWQ